MGSTAPSMGCTPLTFVYCVDILFIRPHSLEAKDIPLSRVKHGFESRWGYVPYTLDPCIRCTCEGSYCNSFIRIRTYIYNMPPYSTPFPKFLFDLCYPVSEPKDISPNFSIFMEMFNNPAMDFCCSIA